MNPARRRLVVEGCAGLLGVPVAALASLPSLPAAAGPAGPDAELVATGARIAAIQREQGFISEAMRDAGPFGSPAQCALEERTFTLVDEEVAQLRAMAARPSATAAGIQAKARAAWDTWPGNGENGQPATRGVHDEHLLSLLRDMLRDERA